MFTTRHTSINSSQSRIPLLHIILGSGGLISLAATKEECQFSRSEKSARWWCRWRASFDHPNRYPPFMAFPNVPHSGAAYRSLQTDSRIYYHLRESDDLGRSVRCAAPPPDLVELGRPQAFSNNEHEASASWMAVKFFANHSKVRKFVKAPHFTSVTRVCRIAVTVRPRASDTVQDR